MDVILVNIHKYLHYEIPSLTLDKIRMANDKQANVQTKVTQVQSI